MHSYRHSQRLLDRIVDAWVVRALLYAMWHAESCSRRQVEPVNLLFGLVRTERERGVGMLHDKQLCDDHLKRLLMEIQAQQTIRGDDFEEDVDGFVALWEWPLMTCGQAVVEVVRSALDDHARAPQLHLNDLMLSRLSDCQLPEIRRVFDERVGLLGARLCSGVDHSRIASGTTSASLQRAIRRVCTRPDLRSVLVPYPRCFDRTIVDALVPRSPLGVTNACVLRAVLADVVWFNRSDTELVRHQLSERVSTHSDVYDIQVGRSKISINLFRALCWAVIAAQRLGLMTICPYIVLICIAATDDEVGTLLAPLAASSLTALSESTLRPKSDLYEATTAISDRMIFPEELDVLIRGRTSLVRRICQAVIPGRQ